MKPKMTHFIICIIISALSLISNATVYASEVQQVESSGLKALLIEEKSVPVFTLRISFKHSGNAWQAPEKQGISYLASTLMNEGAGSLNALAFQKELERNAIRFYGSADADLFSLSLQSLSEKQDKALELLLLALTEPRFDEEAINRMRGETLSDLARLEGRPAYVAARAWWLAAFGDHPYGREARGTAETLKHISRSDLKKFVRERFAKDNIMIAAAGDISSETLKSLLDKIAKTLPEKSTGEHDVASRVPTLSKDPIRISREVPQSVVMFGLPGVARKDPRFFAAYVMNYILGGGELSSRLMDSLRQDKGLVYSVSTDLSTLEKSAVFSGMLASSNETAEEAIAAVKTQLSLMGEKGVTEKELNDAKAYLVGSFPLNMDSNDQLVSYLMSIQLHDLGLDYLTTRNDKIRAVSLDQLNAVAKEMFSGKDPLISIAGAAIKK
jgi:zinc protease